MTEAQLQGLAESEYPLSFFDDNFDAEDLRELATAVLAAKSHRHRQLNGGGSKKSGECLDAALAALFTDGDDNG